MVAENPIGEYLRARRALITPEEAGIPRGAGRRVPGLRREELAMLAGISADYYLRLERGKDQHPSPQVLGALARVLRLDLVAERHLFELAGPLPVAAEQRVRLEAVPQRLHDLLTLLPVPAFVEGRWADVLAVNPLATALSPRLAVGENRLSSFFLDPAERSFHRDWNVAAPLFVAALRQSIGPDVEHPRAKELVGGLSRGSEEFRRLWNRHDVLGPQSSGAVVDHPLVGELRFDREKLTTSEGLVLVAYHAVPGSVTADRLALLASYTAPERTPRARSPRPTIRR